MQLKKMSLHRIWVDPSHNSRSKEGYGDVLELAQDMLQRGQLQPVVVKPLAEPQGDFTHRLVFGYRRCRAAQKLGWKEISALEVRADLTAAEMDQYRYAENSKREPLTVLDEACFVLRYIKQHQTQGENADLTYRAVADALNIQPARFKKLYTIATQLDPEVIRIIRESRLSTSLVVLHDIAKKPASEQLLAWYESLSTTPAEVAQLRLQLDDILRRKERAVVTAKVHGVDRGATITDRVGLAVEALAHDQKLAGATQAEWTKLRGHLWKLCHYLRDGGHFPFAECESDGD